MWMAMETICTPLTAEPIARIATFLLREQDAELLVGVQGDLATLELIEARVAADHGT